MVQSCYRVQNESGLCTQLAQQVLSRWIKPNKYSCLSICQRRLYQRHIVQICLQPNKGVHFQVDIWYSRVLHVHVHTHNYYSLNLPANTNHTFPTALSPCTKSENDTNYYSCHQYKHQNRQQHSHNYDIYRERECIDQITLTTI